MDAQPEKNKNTPYRLAVLSLILGILSILGSILKRGIPYILGSIPLLPPIFTSFLFSPAKEFLMFLGLPAVIIGRIALSRMKDEKVGKVYAIAGITLGLLSTIYLISLRIFIFFAY